MSALQEGSQSVTLYTLLSPSAGYRLASYHLQVVELLLLS
jgi:hypothetical protein